MTLSRLVHLRNEIDQLEFEPHCGNSIRHLDGILYNISNHDCQIDNLSIDLKNNFNAVSNAVHEFQATVVKLRGQIQSQIAMAEPGYFQESLRLYTEEMCFETSDYILDRRLPIDQENDQILRGRLHAFNDWRLPGMVLRPGRETFVKDLVALDPLYLVDHSEDLLTECVKLFAEPYQRRLRSYIINDRAPGTILAQLPDKQFGMVFAYNYFNFKPLELIKRYLAEIANKLRPGGVLIMTYNDCDKAHNVALVERHFMCYTPGTAIRQYAESLGFTTVYQHSGSGDLSWIELKKFGEIKSLRGGQTLARIIAKSK